MANSGTVMKWEKPLFLTKSKVRLPSATIASLMGLYLRSAGKPHSLDKGHCINVEDIRISSLFKGNSNQLVNSDTHQPIESYAGFSFAKQNFAYFYVTSAITTNTLLSRFSHHNSTVHGYKQFQGPSRLHLLPWRRRWEFLQNFTPSRPRTPWSRNPTLQGDAARIFTELLVGMFHCKCEYFTKTTHISSCLSSRSHISWFFWHYRCRWNQSRTGQRTSPLSSNNLAELSVCSSTMPQRHIRGHDGKCPRINPVNKINVKSLALPASTHIHASVHMYCTPARRYLSKNSFYFHLQKVWRDYVLCIKTRASQKQCV